MSSLINRSAVRDAAMELGKGRVTQISPAVYDACNRAVLAVLQRAVSQQSRTSTRLLPPIDTTNREV